MKRKDTVKLISADEMEFIIDKDAAMVSQTIGGFAEMELGEVTFPEISAVILEKICQYFYWALQYSRFVFLYQCLVCVNAVDILNG
ncbi:hypothetical protein ES332_A03G063000v1 [Gossypium tomentosum]|uniref:Elongin-C n=1 Tax=Gossypium tomentosum TaxID=34277 RepID=A0A5D2R701_GOSTO|nr:hypothetical protein ES332_A03G063000v1 [Gossypium tomentosum]